MQLSRAQRVAEQLRSLSPDELQVALTSIGARTADLCQRVKLTVYIDKPKEPTPRRRRKPRYIPNIIDEQGNLTEYGRV